MINCVQAEINDWIYNVVHRDSYFKDELYESDYWLYQVILFEYKWQLNRHEEVLCWLWSPVNYGAGSSSFSEAIIFHVHSLFKLRCFGKIRRASEHWWLQPLMNKCNF
jgi:hypothetical protein